MERLPKNDRSRATRNHAAPYLSKGDESYLPVRVGVFADVAQRCQQCSRHIYAPESLRTGLGPSCRKRLRGGAVL